MKVKNIVFPGFAAAILATGMANAAPSMATQGYVDQEVGKVQGSVNSLNTTLTNNYATTTAVQNTINNSITQAVSGDSGAIKQALDTKENSSNKKSAINEESSTASTDFPTVSAVVNYTKGAISEAVTNGININTDKIERAAITEDKLRDGAVTEPKIATGAVTTNKIADKNVTEGKLADDVVAKINAAQTAANVADAIASAVSADTGAVKVALDGKQDKLTAGANVTIAGDGTISAKDTTYGAATATTAGLVKIGANVTVAEDGTISVADPTVDSALNDTSANPVQNKVLNAALNTKENTSNKTDAIVKEGQDDDTAFPTVAAVKTWTTGQISGMELTADNIPAGLITGDKLQEGTITSTQLGANSVTTEKIVDNAVTEGKLAEDVVAKIDAAQTEAQVSGAIDAALTGENGVIKAALDTKQAKLTADNLVKGDNVEIAFAEDGKITVSAVDTITTATADGTGNTVTSVTANNGALTVSMGNMIPQPSAACAADSGRCVLSTGPDGFTWIDVTATPETSTEEVSEG